MLDKIAKLDAHVIRALLVVFVGFIGTVGGTLGFLDPDKFSAAALKIVEGISELLIGLGVAYAWYARTYMPTPPISDHAVKKTIEKMGSQEKE